MQIKITGLVTIGVYGFDEETFFGALQAARVDVFCDIRQRRGVRGSRYAFVNKVRLKDRLKELDINYVHCHNLAPTPEIRQLQSLADKELRTTKRGRPRLAPPFIDAFEREVLEKFDSKGLLRRLPETARVIALHCVEEHAAACHRSLVADRLARDWGLKPMHITP